MKETGKMTEINKKDKYISLVDKLEKERVLSKEEFRDILICDDEVFLAYLKERADIVRRANYGDKVYLRGLIEFSNYCRNNCKYCGIRRDNKNAERYRLSMEDIVSCADIGYKLGFRTFVLQGGEDLSFSDDDMVSIIKALKENHPDCAVTLSIGEREKDSYEKFYAAGADRYLLRHETADKEHYNKLHPSDMSFDHRMKCLKDLHDIGYQVGAGMMVGSPYQTIDNIVSDLLFLAEFKPEMVGIGPFIPHHDTEFKDEPAGSVEMTLRLLSIIRLMLPKALIPATTALGTLDPLGREKGLASGANVVMPNLSPANVRGKYLLYDNKICTGDEAAECIRCMTLRVEKSGYHVVNERGDFSGWNRKDLQKN